MKDKDMSRDMPRKRQDQAQTSRQMDQQQKQRDALNEHVTSPETLGGQPGQQNAGSGQGKDSLNNFDIDTSGKKQK